MNTFPKKAIPFVLALGLVSGPAASADDQDPNRANGVPTGNLVGTLVPPDTNYRAILTDPEGATLAYEWSADLSCGTFQPGVPTPDAAIWGHGAEDGCPHNTPSHPGTITVVVTDPEGNEVTCTYSGSLSGSIPCESLLAVSIGDVKARESVFGGFLSFDLTLSRATDVDVLATVETTPSSACEAVVPAGILAEERNDYAQTREVVVIPAGGTLGTFNVDVFDDLLDEKRETFTATILSATNAVVGRAQGIGTIKDDDDLGSDILVEVKGPLENEGPVKGEIALMGGGEEVPSGRVAKVTVTTEDGSARAGSDYVARSTRLTFFPPGCGERGKTRFRFNPIPLVDDDVNEGNSLERFFIVLRDPVNVQIGFPGRVSIRIADDDTP